MREWIGQSEVAWRKPDDTTSMSLRVSQRPYNHRNVFSVRRSALRLLSNYENTDSRGLGGYLEGMMVIAGN
jgi:hypothetical protein